jgi:CDP-diacylglycerol--serine O-phosphatidyltransferase
VAAFGLLLSFPFEMLTAITIVFLATIPAGVLRYRKLDRDHAVRTVPSEVEPPAA